MFDGVKEIESIFHKMENPAEAGLNTSTLSRTFQAPSLAAHAFAKSLLGEVAPVGVAQPSFSSIAGQLEVYSALTLARFAGSAAALLRQSGKSAAAVASLTIFLVLPAPFQSPPHWAKPTMIVMRLPAAAPISAGLIQPVFIDQTPFRVCQGGITLILRNAST